MNNNILILILFIIISGCSLDTKTGIWSETVKIEKEKDPIIKEIFKKEDVLKKEFNPFIRINLKSAYKKESFINNLTNNNGYINYDGNLEKISKYKFSKLKQFKFTQPDLLFTEDKSIIFFDNKGSIFKLNENSELFWKKNYYSKSQKKTNPVLFLASSKNYLIVADSIANYYAINIVTGEIIWKKTNSAPFNSQIKIYDNKIFAIDFDNVLRCFSLQNGKEIWNFKTEETFIKSQQKLSLIISKNRVAFINTLGDVSSLDINAGKLLWQMPTQSNVIYESSFSLKNSDLVLDNETIFFSNNKNELFSLDFKTGVIKWKQNINSNLRPTIIDKLIFSVTNEGYLIITDSITGNIIRVTNIFGNYKIFKKKEIEATGFVVGKNKIYVSFNNGRLISVDVKSGNVVDLMKIDGDKISRPYILNKKMYLIRDNAIIKIN